MLVCGVIGGGLLLRRSNRPEKGKQQFTIRNVFFIPLNPSVRRENHVKKSRKRFCTVESLGTDRKSKMEWPKFVNVIALGLPHENWSFIADLRNLFLDPANSSSSRLPGYGECYSQRHSSSYAALCCGAPLREVRCSAARFEQPLTGRLQTSCHDLTDPLEELKTKRVISFGVFAQNCPVENNGRSGLTRTSADTPPVRRE